MIFQLQQFTTQKQLSHVDMDYFSRIPSLAETSMIVTLPFLQDLKESKELTIILIWNVCYFTPIGSCSVRKVNHGWIGGSEISHGENINYSCTTVGYEKKITDEPIRCEFGTLVPMGHACVRCKFFNYVDRTEFIYGLGLGLELRVCGHSSSLFLTELTCSYTWDVVWTNTGVCEW